MPGSVHPPEIVTGWRTSSATAEIFFVLERGRADLVDDVHASVEDAGAVSPEGGSHVLGSDHPQGSIRRTFLNKELKGNSN